MTPLGRITPRDIKRAEEALFENDDNPGFHGTVRTPQAEPVETGWPRWLKPGAHPTDPPGYEDLREIMEDAFNFAARGKGHKRHGQNGEPWHEQRHARIGRALGEGFAIGQAMKKAEESTGLQDEAAIKELLGAMTYLASAIYIIREGHR